MRKINKIQIEITTKCSLKCFNCGAFCNQIPPQEDMTISQIKKFIKQTKNSKKKWDSIDLSGGEPTLHPNFQEIVELIYESNITYNLIINTNGYINETKQKLKKVKKYPRNIRIYNTKKTGNIQYFRKILEAPIDQNLKNQDYSKGCWALEKCGIGLNIYGYYPCLQSGTIDKILGLNIGVNHFNDLDYSNICNKLCKYCGNFNTKGTDDELIYSDKNYLSEFWIKTFKDYKTNKPTFKLF